MENTKESRKGRAAVGEVKKEFEVCFGEFTPEEKEHLLEIGHIFETSTGEIHDVSTLTESDFAEDNIFDITEANIAQDEDKENANMPNCDGIESKSTAPVDQDRKSRSGRNVSFALETSFGLKQLFPGTPVGEVQGTPILRRSARTPKTLEKCFGLKQVFQGTPVGEVQGTPTLRRSARKTKTLETSFELKQLFPLTPVRRSARKGKALLSHNDAINKSTLSESVVGLEALFECNSDEAALLEVENSTSDKPGGGSFYLIDLDRSIAVEQQQHKESSLAGNIDSTEKVDNNAHLNSEETNRLIIGGEKATAFLNQSKVGDKGEPANDSFLGISCISGLLNPNESGIEDVSDVTHDVSLSLSVLESSSARNGNQDFGLKQLFPETPVTKVQGTPILWRSAKEGKSELSHSEVINMPSLSDSVVGPEVLVDCHTDEAVTKAKDSTFDKSESSFCLIDLDRSIAVEQQQQKESSSTGNIEFGDNVDSSAYLKSQDTNRLVVIRGEKKADFLNLEDKVEPANDSFLGISCINGLLNPNESGIEDVSDVTRDVSLSLSMLESSSTRNEEKDVTKEDLEDTIELMDKLLALAEEQEAEEARESEINTEEANMLKNFKIKTQSVQSGQKQVGAPSPVLVKRVLELKKKGRLFSPSPPRPRPGMVPLRSKAAPKTNELASQQVFKVPTPRRTTNVVNVASPTLTKGSGTPTKTRLSFVGVQAKVDSGLRMGSPGGVSLGLNSPVANYIHSEAAPSPFRRVGFVSNKAASVGKMWPMKNFKPVVSNLRPLSMIPRPSLPHDLESFVLSPRRSAPVNISLLKSATKLNTQGKRDEKFKEKQYTAAPKVQSLNESSFIQKHQKENYLAERHTGVRDSSGNASIIQNGVVPKSFIPSRLITPKSYAK